MNDWDDIRYFLEVARSGNVTGAAKQLGVNHSTVSRRIRALEEKHGVRLFERISSGYEMTAAASNIFELALQIESQNHQVSRQLFGQDQRLQGELNITMPHDIFDYCLADDLALFHLQQPDIQLNLHVSKGLKNLAAREADVAIRLTPAPPDYLIGTEIAKLQHGFYAHTDCLNLLMSGQSIPIIDWTQNQPSQPLHNREYSSLPGWTGELLEGLETLFALGKTHEAKVVMRVDDLHSMQRLMQVWVLHVCPVTCPMQLRPSFILATTYHQASSAYLLLNPFPTGAFGYSVTLIYAIPPAYELAVNF